MVQTEAQDIYDHVLAFQMNVLLHKATIFHMFDMEKVTYQFHLC